MTCPAAHNFTVPRRSVRRRPDLESGFSLIEAVVATTVLSVAVVSLAELLSTATRVNATSRQATRAVILAEQKLEQLRALAWYVEDGGVVVSDVSSNLAAFPATPACAAATNGAAVGLTTSPTGTLTTNVDGYVDYVDAHGCGLGGGVVPPAGSAFIRRWSIRPSDIGPGTLAFEVLVSERGLRTAGDGSGSGGRRPDETRLAGVKTRRTP
jgi:type II secretory pathway pseudopilin PulG